jgi:Mrp family chromosome partitioning ATPase
MSDKCAENGTCSGCSNADGCTAEEKQKREAEVLEARLSHIKHRIVVMSGKGGVGKSTVAVSLAVSLALKGRKVGLLDADIHGPNLPKMLGLDNQRLQAGESGIIPQPVMENLAVVSMAFLLENPDSPVVWRGPLKHTVIRQFVADVQWGELDYLIIDLPPGTGDEPLSVAQVIKPMDGSVIVTTPQDVALLDSRKSVVFSQQIEVPVLGVVENMSGFVCPHCGEKIDLFKQGGGEKAARELEVPFLGAVPLDPQVVIQGDAGKPFVEAFPDSPTALAFDEIVNRLEERVDAG